MGYMGTSANGDKLAWMSLLNEFTEDALTTLEGLIILKWDSMDAESALATAGIIYLLMELIGGAT